VGFLSLGVKWVRHMSVDSTIMRIIETFKKVLIMLFFMDYHSRGDKALSFKRRRLLAKGIEMAAAMPLIGVLANNFLKSRNYSQVDNSEALVYEKPDTLKQFYNLQHSFRNSLTRLYEEYDQAYYVSHLETRISTDSKGNMTTTMVTVWDWEEPRNVPNHRVISSWRDYQDQITNKTQFLVSNPLIDINKLDNLRVYDKEANKFGQAVLNIGIYGAGTGLLLGYEEILASLRHPGHFGRNMFLSDKVREMNTDKQISRRSFFKVGAAIAGVGVAYKVGKNNQEKLGQGREKLENEIEKSNSFGDVNPDTAFQSYFMATPNSLINKAENCVNTLKSTLLSRVKNKRVRGAFEGVVRQGEQYAQSLRQYFADGVPFELGFISKCAKTTNAIEDISSEQRTGAGCGILLEGLAAGGVMAAILVPAEIINNKFD